VGPMTILDLAFAMEDVKCANIRCFDIQ